MIKSINDKIKIKADNDLRTHNLTLSQSRVLIYLTHNGGQATQKEIEDFLEVSHPTVVGIVSRMEKNGFLDCRPDTLDRRNKLVCLTEHARGTGEDMDSVIGSMEKKMLGPLSDEQVEQLTSMLEIISRNI